MSIDLKGLSSIGAINNSMCNFLLGRLKDDHKRFECLFGELERQCAKKEAGHAVDTSTLEAICGHLRNRTLLFHHALEEAIYARLVQIQPRFRDVYDLTEDHRRSWREFDRFATVVSNVQANFVTATLSFISNERGHYILEEEIFFRHAGKFLLRGDWQDLEQSKAASELMADSACDPIVAGLLQNAMQPPAMP